MNQIAVLDAGGQYCHLIARRVRDLGVYSHVLPLNAPSEQLSRFRGIIISGGPASVYDEASPRLDWDPQSVRVPVLGICYGHQLLASRLGGKVIKGARREFGIATLKKVEGDTILSHVPDNTRVWMSHQDKVEQLPKDFTLLAKTSDCAVAAMANRSHTIFGLQFHPEVSHTEKGQLILRNFLFEICKCENDWRPTERVPGLMKKIRHDVGSRNVFFLISGGVDSTVAFVLTVRALGANKVRGLYVDTGLMRKSETAQIEKCFRDLRLDNVEVLDASDEFLRTLSETTDPEEKRKIIGRLFLQIQARSFSALSAQGEWLLGQGTIYPDTIESGATQHSAKIKTHHNRVEEISELLRDGKLLEPLVEFYKDEVRRLGEELGLPQDVIHRHPFPGPGLAIRCICSDTTGPVKELPKRSGALRRFFVPLNSVGVKGDFRSYEGLVLLEGAANCPQLGRAATSIVNSTASINRVVHLVKAKNPQFVSQAKVVQARLTKGRLDCLREADDIAHTVLRSCAPVFGRVWQMPVVLIPLTTGIGETVVLRPVSSNDGMTAEFTPIPQQLLNEAATRILRIDGVEAVLYDVTNKPPATIEWE